MTRQSGGGPGHAETRPSIRDWLGSHRHYPWIAVALLWFCGFFNYADRQAVFSVFPLLKNEFHLSNTQLSLLGSVFMLVYAVASPFTGYVVDRISRRRLIAAGLTFWSVICAATAFSANFGQLIFFRAAEGLGESFYFPASMSFLADYHGPRTRSRALGIHQTSVYLGTAGGAALTGFLASRQGWRAPFVVLGMVGTVYAIFLIVSLIEPTRTRITAEKNIKRGPLDSDEPNTDRADPEPLGEKLRRIFKNRPAVLLFTVFVGANFVAATFLTWLPTFIFETFDLGLDNAAFTSTFWPLASLPGALLGGIAADRGARRTKGGRIRVQSLGLLLAAPFVCLSGWSTSVPLLIAGLIGAGLCKGIYDSNIFASLFDVVAPEDRGSAAGLMNCLGWVGGFIAPFVVGVASDRLGLGLVIGSTAAVYLLVGLLALLAARLAEAHQPNPA
jgi:MFS family permease